MSKYTVVVSGWVSVEVEANNEDEAQEKAFDETVVGELYDYVVEDVKETEEDK